MKTQKPVTDLPEANEAGRGNDKIPLKKKVALVLWAGGIACVGASVEPSVSAEIAQHLGEEGSAAIFLAGLGGWGIGAHILINEDEPIAQHTSDENAQASHTNV